MAHRAHNFSAGPAVLPVPVLEEIQRDLLSLPGAGASILEISHRSKPFAQILQQAEADLRSLLSIPEDYAVLFLQGGSRLQFSMVPMNLLGEPFNSATYIVTGSWGKHAAGEARKEGNVEVAWNGQSTNFDRLPQEHELQINPAAGYVHFTSNETIQGVQFTTEPKVGSIPLVCDASSDFLCRPLPIKKYGLIYACAQKNAGPAGVTVAIIRRDLLERSRDSLPGYLNYKAHADANSLMNTAPTFAVYAVGLVARWLQNEIGGLDNMLERNRLQAKLLYDVLDSSVGFYTGHAQPDCRSLMNVTFNLPDDSLTAAFLAEAEEHDMISLKGHRSVGGIRASIYNAMSTTGVEQLAKFMTDFRNRNS
jgi:phosphoserine aminotransferase